ncbi:MAG: tetratricopeptide repeat protein [Candidatus Cyclobacteriaceae bacterium M2_1C_046]
MLKTIFFYILIFVTLTAYSQDHDDIQLANEYYSQGESEKAIHLFEELAKDDKNIPLIHNNYFFLLLENGLYSDAEKYLKRITRRFPNNYNFVLDEGYLLYHKNEIQRAEDFFKGYIDEVKGNSFQSRMAAEYFVNKQLHSYAAEVLKAARKTLGNNQAYALELANIYRIMNEKDLMVNEYLNYISSNPSNISYVQNTLQNLLTTPEDLQSLEQLLYAKIQDEPDNKIYPELIIWVNLQQKNFYGAFIQARALDKRFNTQGSRSLEIGTIALDNDDFVNAIKIFSYIVKEFPSTPNYILARMYLIKSYEQRVRNSYPIDEREIRNLVNDYASFIKELGINNRSTMEAMRNKALLHAFYLDEKDSAVMILKELINNPRAAHDIRSASKLDLGDIYLLMDQPWESTLLYSQVEKSNSDSPTGYEAKLKNAKLSYYRGEFLLAQEHLDILKEATTREIANDAMEVSLLIKDNIAFDSTEAAMRAYAAIELLLFQNKIDEAKVTIDSLQNALGFHNLQDELLWLQADILKKEGNFEKALNKLEKINENHSQDILGDDAYFEMAEIHERHLNNKEKAQELYMNFLTKYPGSVYVAEARKRFRQLRGDFSLAPELN